jgi:hypothetical protein
METPEESHYNKRYHLQRALKPVLNIDSHKRTIDMPEGLQLGKTDQKRVNALVKDYGYVIQVVLPIDRFTKVMINSSKGLKGSGLQFRKEMFFKLKAGTMVDQIGKGKEVAGNMVDKFKKPYTYTGSIYIDSLKYYAFQVNQELVQDNDQQYYILYTGTDNEIRRDLYKRGMYDYTRVMKPEFKEVKSLKKQTKQESLKF